MDEPERKGFWTSLPGLLTQAAAVISALALVLTAIDKLVVAIPHWPWHGGKIKEPKQGTAACDTSAVPAGGAATDVLAAANGGALVVQGSRNWERMIDGDEDQGVQIGEIPGDFGIYSFRDGHAARIAAFTTMVPQATGMNPTAIELSYATASASGPFTAIGTFPVINGRVAPDGLQTFRFDPVVACFLKIKLHDSQGGNQYVTGWEFGALGAVADR